MSEDGRKRKEAENVKRKRKQPVLAVKVASVPEKKPEA